MSAAYSDGTNITAVNMNTLQGSIGTAQIADDAITTAKILDANVTTAKINNSAVTDAKIATVAASKLTGALPAISGANLTNLPAETKPTISSISPTVIENTQTSITITGTNFVNGANVEAVATNGAIIQADTITRVTSGEGDNVYRVVIMEPYIGSLDIGDRIELQSREDNLKYHLATVRGIISDLDKTEGNVLLAMENETGFVSSESDNTEALQIDDEPTNSLL